MDIKPIGNLCARLRCPQRKTVHIHMYVHICLCTATSLLIMAVVAA